MFLIIGYVLAAMAAGVAVGYFMALPALIVAGVIAVVALVVLGRDINDPKSGSGAIGIFLIYWLPLLFGLIAMIVTAIVVRWSGELPDMKGWFLR